SNLGLLLKAQGEYARGLVCCQKALEMEQKLYPEDEYPQGHPDLATSFRNLGFLLQAQGEYTKARGHYQKALGMQQKLYPKDKYPQGHPDLAMSFNNLGFLLLAQGESGKALDSLQQALDMEQGLFQVFAEAASEAESFNLLAKLPWTRDAILMTSAQVPS